MLDDLLDAFGRSMPTKNLPLFTADIGLRCLFREVLPRREGGNHLFDFAGDRLGATSQC